MSKIISLQSENIKRLRAVYIEPKSALVTLGGDNGEGKSSVLDSIAMGLGGKDYVPDVPVRRGEESAEIVIKLDNGIVVKRTFTAAGNTYLKVTAADGAVYPSPQAMLDSLTGKLTFDPLAFLKLDAKAQAETLRKLVNLDFTAHDAARKKVYDERAAVNKRLTEMRGAVAALPHHPDAPAAEVSSADVIAQIEAAQKHNAAQTELDSSVNAALFNVNACAENVAKTQTLIDSLEKQLNAARVQLAKDTKAKATYDEVLVNAQIARAAFEPKDTTALKAQLASAEETNRRVRANAQRAKAIEEGKAKKAEADKLTAKLEAMDKEKSEKLAAVKFPVEGLSFADDVVTYQGLPLSQASSAAQQRVSVAIGAALNPKLRVMIIRDASLLDGKNLEALRQTAEELDLQVWAERVSQGAECSVIIEDGAVRGAPPVESSKSEPAAKSTARKRATTNKATTAAPTVEIEDTVPEGAAF